MNPTDTTITEKMRTNPDEGMRMLMDEYQERLYWHVRRLVVYEDDTEDMLQEIFIKIYLKFDSFKGNSSLFSWIYRLATNETLSFLRKKKVSNLPLDNARLQAADSFSNMATRRRWRCRSLSTPCLPNSKRCSI